ncbi:MAG: PilZ domain-containing protein [Candidatus Aureabacteria bacterium]|nr:PilZ domain-containing protein [Candidatus Auribacterota bacterium]
MDENRISQFYYSGEERRHYRRFPFVFPIKYTYLGNNLEKLKPSEFSLYSFSNNISRGGMMLLISNNIPAGEYIGLTITLPIEQEAISINVTGKVKWIDKEDDGYLAGIEFCKITEHDLDIIQKMVDLDIY